MIHSLPFNARPSQKKSECPAASMTGLRNASRNSCRFATESERVGSDQESLDFIALFAATWSGPQFAADSPAARAGIGATKEYAFLIGVILAGAFITHNLNFTANAIKKWIQKYIRFKRALNAKSF